MHTIDVGYENDDLHALPLAGAVAYYLVVG